MIVSASYKTDIPAFYGKWFMNRLRAGSCKMTNAWNGATDEVSLKPDDVDAFVFWTKNLGPFRENLDEVAKLGFPFIVQYTINGYPRTLEVSVVDADKSVEHMHDLCKTFGFGVAIWRYDPIVISSETNYGFHLANFQQLAEKIKGSTDEVVISFMHAYGKTIRNMNAQSTKRGFTWEDPLVQEKQSLLQDLIPIAEANGMKVRICAQPENQIPGTEAAHCIDASRIKRVWSTKFISRTKGNRPGCLCAGSKDIGEYNTCPHGCVYCYAVENRELAKGRYRAHDPNSPFIFNPEAQPDFEDER